MMQLTVQFKLLPTWEQRTILEETTKEYIRAVNCAVADFVQANEPLKYSSKNIAAELPSALRGQIAQDAKSIFKKYAKNIKANAKLSPDKQKEVKVPVLKKPVAIWNNQNYAVKFEHISFPVWLKGKSTRIVIKAVLTPYQKNLLGNKFGTLRISKKSGKYIAQVAVAIEEQPKSNGQTMGIDLGLKIPAVAVLQNSKAKFFGNGRQNKYIKRKHRSKRRKLSKLKKQKAINKLNNKEQRWMKDQDHKVSRQIVNFAKENNVSIVRLEQLSGIRQTARTSRKNEKSLHTWSFYRLAQYIEYKAMLEGMTVEFVKPEYTSQICPACGEKNKANDRKYKCTCGFKTHRDILGARNIINAPVADGNSLPA